MTDPDRARQVAAIAKDPELIEGLLAELLRYRAGDNRIAGQIVAAMRKRAKRWQQLRSAPMARCGRELEALADYWDPERRHG